MPLMARSVPNPTGRGLVISSHPEDGPVVKDAVVRVLKGESQESVAESIGMSKSGFASLLRNPRLAASRPLVMTS